MHLAARNPSSSIPDLLKKLSGVYQENFLQTLLPDLVANFHDIDDLSFKNKAVIEALEAMQPKDAHELMLCIQILALHRQGMNFMHKLSHADGKFADRYSVLNFNFLTNTHYTLKMKRQ